MISDEQFFLATRIFFFLLNALQDIFFSPHFSAGYFFSPHFSAGFFPQKRVVFTFTECNYIYIVVIAVIVLIWSCKAYTKSFLYSYMFSECHSLESFNT